jgi:hypothetical protein
MLWTEEGEFEVCCVRRRRILGAKRLGQLLSLAVTHQVIEMPKRRNATNLNWAVWPKRVEKHPETRQLIRTLRVIWS